MERVNKMGFAGVLVGAVTVFAPLPAGWTLAGGILALGLGAAAMVTVLQPRTGH